MKKMISIALLLIVLSMSAAAIGTQTATPKYPVHWMSNPPAKCATAANYYGQQVCIRQRHNRRVLA